MKTLHLSIIVIIGILIFSLSIDITTAFAQVAPVAGLPHAFFKTDQNVYPIQYNLTNGRLVANLVDLPTRALIFIFNATEAGQLTVELPRQIIDSTKDGKDKPYLVFVGNLESGVKRSKANEVQNNNTTRTLTINFAKGENEVQITGTFFVENKSSYVSINPFGAFSSLMQFKKGIDAQDVICKESFVLVTKYDGSPACVKPESEWKLIERGWTTTDFSKEKIRVEEIIGAKILDMLFDDENKSLLVQMNSFSDGHIIITIPRNILDTKIQGEDDDFFILVDGKEVNFEETKNNAERTFTIPLESDSKEIEITIPILI